MSSNSNEKQNHVVETTQTQQIDDNDTVSAMVLGVSLVFPAILNAAIELKLFEIIGDEFMSASEIASKLPTQHPDLPNRLDRMLRLLASYSLLSSSTKTNGDGSLKRVYAITPSGKYFTYGQDIDHGYLGSFTSFMFHPTMIGMLSNIKEAVVDPEVDLFKKVNGISIYEYMGKDAELNHKFNKSMNNIAGIQMKKILEIYKGFEGISTLVDVGGGNGQTLKMIIAKYPSIKAINFDLPQIIENLSPISGIEHVGGSMFESIPHGDAIILKAICHNWSDEKCIEILSNCHKALPQHGKVILVECALLEQPEATNAFRIVSIIDNMMFLHSGGKERYQEEYESLALRSGFSRLEVVCCAVSHVGVMEIHK